MTRVNQYVVAHIWGGLLESLKPADTREEADRLLKGTIPDPCDCEGGCESYQEAFIYQFQGEGVPALSLADIHSPYKS